MLIAAAIAAPVSGADNYGGVGRSTRQAVTQEVHRYWSGWEAESMLRCIRRESGFNPRAVNWGDANGGSHGLAQINGIHRSAFARIWHLRYTIKGGVQMAYRLYRGDRAEGGNGFGPWGGPC